MFVDLFTTVLAARRYPTTFLTIQQSPTQAMCILILVSHWSLIETSILIPTPFYFNDVLLQPAHIPLLIMSLLIMISLCLYISDYSATIHFKFSSYETST